MEYKNFNVWIIYSTYIYIFFAIYRKSEREIQTKSYKDFFEISASRIKNSGDANALFLMLILFHCMGGE